MEVYKILLEKKFELLNVIAITGMTWWVSSIVFCGTALGIIWTKRSDIINAPFFGWLSLLLGVFFTSIVFFGVWMMFIVSELEIEVINIMHVLKIKEDVSNIGFTALWGGYLIGSTSFTIVTILWALMWNSIKKERDKKT